MNRPSTIPPRRSQNPDDLSVLQRRGDLSNAEARRLRMALLASEPLRCSHQLGQDFDAMVTETAGDTKLIEQAVLCARARHTRPARVRARVAPPRVLPWIGVLALLLGSAVAGASLWPYAKALVVPAHLGAPTQISPARVPTAANPVRTAISRANLDTPQAVPLETAMSTRVQLPRTQPELPTPGPIREQHSTAEITANSPVRTQTDTTVMHAEPEEHSGIAVADDTQRRQPFSDGSNKALSANELLAAANLARRSGDLVRARGIYKELLATYPTSSETALACVLLGRLDLQRNAATEALSNFERYLRLAPSGPLAEEALEGRALSLRLLTRNVEEATAWRELLSRFPQSIYAKTARERLHELP